MVALNRWRRALCVAPVAAAALTAGRAWALSAGDERVLHLPTPPPVVDAMLELAEVRRGDVVFDLGSGDGRIPIAAARTYGVRAVGIELDADLVEQSRRNARAAGVERLVEFRRQDLFASNLRDASVVTLFLFRELNLRLRPKLLRELQPGARIVSHRFDLGDWAPERRREVDGFPIFRWTVAAS